MRIKFAFWAAPICLHLTQSLSYPCVCYCNLELIQAIISVGKDIRAWLHVGVLSLEGERSLSSLILKPVTVLLTSGDAEWLPDNA